MSKQYSTTLRNGWLDLIESTIGTSPKLRFMSGTQPASCATAQSGTQLIELTLPSDWMNNASGGSKTLLGTWSGTVATTGTAGYYRIYDSSGTTCHEQGAITTAFSLTTSASTASGSNVLTFASTTGVANGQAVTGSGIPSGTTIASFTSTTVNLSVAATATINSSTPIYFGSTTGDLWLNSTALTTGQTVTISTKTVTAPGA